MIPEYIHGSIAPVFTSFDEDGAFHEQGQRNFLDFLIERGGISAYFVRCGMGQMYTFSYEDVEAMARTACGHLAGKAPVLVGTTGVWDRNNDKRPDPEVFTNQAVELSKFAEGLGSDAVVHTVPQAILPQSGQTHADVLQSYFDTVAGAVTCPVVIYQPPGTDEDYQVTMDSVRQLADIPNVVAIKLSTTDAQYIHNITWAVAGKDFAIITGAETAFLAGLASGTKAVIGQGATVNPQILNAIQDRFDAGDLEGAREAQWITNDLVEQSTSTVEFMKLLAAENGYGVPRFSRSMKSNPYMKDSPPLPQDQYEAFKNLLESALAKYPTT